jgi:hypothetical protein
MDITHHFWWAAYNESRLFSLFRTQQAAGVSSSPNGRIQGHDLITAMYEMEYSGIISMNMAVIAIRGYESSR